ncbi:MAG: hypothetical protein ABIP48_26590 [Planctomycetota bacterium]
MSENPYESPRTETKWPRPWRFIPAAELARIILESLQENQRREHEYRVVDGRAFRHLSGRFYRRTQRELEALGFTLIGDLEDVTLNATSVSPRTFIRTMVDRSGTTVAAFYHVKPRILGRIYMLLAGIPSKCVEFESHTPSGRTYCTTATPNSTWLPVPDAIKREPASTSFGAADLYDRHLQSLATHRESEPLMRIRNVEDLIRVQNLQNRQVYDHLEEIGWATTDYLRNQGVPAAMVDEVYREIQLRLAVDRMNDELAATGSGEENEAAESSDPDRSAIPPGRNPFR